jgi:hypothetical protein
MDREKKHFHRHALLNANGFPHAPPHLDAHAEQHAASDLYSLANPYLAPCDYVNTHPDPASHVDSLPDADTCDTERNVDSLSDADPASHRHLFRHSHTHRDPGALKTAVNLHML